VGTKCYKPPELLLRQKNYTPMLDIWTSGVVLAEMIYQTKPLFPYISNEELMLKQVLKRCRSGYDILTENYREIFGKIKQ
jgi:serine/threonine protein kinase